MKRAILSLLLVAALVGSAFATGTTEAPESQGEPVTVRILSMHRHTLEVMERKVAEFNASRSDIQIEHEVHENLREMLRLADASGQMPDIFTHYSGDINDSAAYGIPLTEVFEQSYIDEMVIPELLVPQQTVDAEGNFYWFPNNTTVARLAINADLAREAGLDPTVGPRSYAEFVEWAEKISDLGPDTYGLGLNYPNTINLMIWPLSMGSGLLGVNGYTHSADPAVDYTREIETVWMLREIVQAGHVPPDMAAISYDEIRRRFAVEGNIGMILARNYDVGVFTEQFPAQIEWTVVPLPTLSGDYSEGRGWAQLSGYDYVIAEATENLEATKEVYRYLYSKDNVLAELHRQAMYNFAWPEMQGIETVKPNAGAFAFDPSTDAVWPPTYKRVSYQGTNHAEGYARILLEENMTRQQAIEILASMSEVANAAVQRGIEDGTNAGVPTWEDFDIIEYQNGDL